MFRRSRFSVRPNVSTAGRTAAAPQEAPPVSQQGSDTPKGVGESSTAIAATDGESVVTPSEKPTANGDGKDQNGEGTISSAAVQRRKRFTVKPKVAPGRLSTLPRTPKSPVKTAPEIPVEVAASDVDRPTKQPASPTAAPQGLRSPRRQRPSEEGKQPRLKATPTPVLPEGSGPSAVPPTEDLSTRTHLSNDDASRSENTAGSQAKEVLSRLPDTVPSSLPEKETVEISEKAKTLVSSKGRPSMSPAALSLSRLLNDSSDLQRIAKARKLRELIRAEMHKEKKIKKAKLQAKEFTLDPAKMTMRDLIHYLPLSNSMTSSLEEPAAVENEFVIPSFLGREKSPETAQEPEAPPKMASPREEEEEGAAEEEEEAAEGEQEEASLVPQVKVAEDGSLIIDEESLTVEVLRAKGPNPADGRDPIFERGSTTTYSSFRKPTYSKPWFSEETDMFFLAISMVGTDFSMICQLFPHRARSEIKNKFKKEERENSWRVDKAFRERRKLDIEYFSKLLEKILEVHKNRKKLKSLVEKNATKKHKRKPKGKKAAPRNELSDLDEEDENDDLLNEEETPFSMPSLRCKRKGEEDASNEEPDNKKNKVGQESSQQDEACIPEDAEAALPEDRANSDTSENTESGNAATDTVIKPAKLSRGRAPKPLLPLGKKWGKKPSLPSSEADDVAPDKGGDAVSEGASEEQVKKDASPLRQVNERKSADDDVSSEDEGDAVRPPKPTRYGRMPKPTKPLTYPAKADPRSAAPDARPKAKSTTKRRGPTNMPSECKKPKLVTLRASQSEDSDEENENRWEEEEEAEEEQGASSSGQDGTAPAFVPAILRSPHPVIPDTEETMEELDILVTMSDVMGITQDALGPDVSCELAETETGTGPAEPCEHQEELLLDVIDFLSSENTEVTDDDRYNEAAQTLLTMGTVAEFSQSAQEHPAGITSASGNKTSIIASEPAAQQENGATPLTAAASVQDSETSENVAAAEAGGMLMTDTSDRGTGSDMDLTTQLQASPERSDEKPPPTRRGRLSKVKPKPNLVRAHAKSRPVTSTGRAGEGSQTVASGLHQASDSLSAEKISTASDFSQNVSLEEVPCSEVKVEEKPSGSQESADRLKSGAARPCVNTPEDQSQCSSDPKVRPGVEQATRDATRESTDEIQSDTAVAELQGSGIDSAVVQQSSDCPGQCLTPVEDLPAGERAESNAATLQVEKSPFHKAKPNLAQTSRGPHPETQTIREAFEENADPAPNPRVDEKTAVNIEVDHGDAGSAAKPSQMAGPASDDPMTPPLAAFSARTPTEEASTTEELKSRDESGAFTSHRGTAETQNLSETQCVASREQAPSDSTVEPPVSYVGATEGSPGNSMTSHSAIPEGTGHGATSVRESDPPAPRTTRERERGVTSDCQVRRGPKVKAKPNLPQASRRLRREPQTADGTSENTCIASPVSDVTPSLDESATIAPVDASSVSEDTKTGVGVVGRAEPGGADSDQSHPEPSQTSLVLVPSLESAPTEELTSTGRQKVDVGSAPESMSEGSEQKVPQRRQRFSKVKPKPNLGSNRRNKQTGPSKSSEPSLKDDSSDKTSTRLRPAEEKDGERLTSSQHSSHADLLASAALGPAADKDLSSGGISSVAPSAARSLSTESVVETTSSNETRRSAGESTGDKVEAGPASQRDHQRDTSATETNTRPTGDPTAMSSEGGSGPAETRVGSAQTESTADPNEDTRQPRSSNDAEAQRRDADRRSESSGNNRVASQSADGSEAEPTGSSKCSRKPAQIRRGRLVKPRPNLGRKSQARHVRSQTQAGSGSHLEGADASVSHKSVSEGQPDIQEPLEGAVNQDSPANDAGSSQSCSAHVPDSSSQSQHGSISGTGGIQSPTFSDMLLLQGAPSDPDESFFILSLTEIPVSSLGEVEESASDFLPCLPVADASVWQQSCGPAEGSATAGDEPSNVSAEEIGEAGVVDAEGAGPGRAADGVYLIPSLCEEGKLQVKAKAQRMKQAGRTLSATEVEPIPTGQESELPGPPVQPEQSGEVIADALGGSIDPLYIKKTLRSGEEPVDSNPGAQTAQTKRASGQKRSPRGVPSSSSSSPETNNAAPSTSCDVAPTPSPTPLSEETRLTPSPPPPAEEEGTSERSPLLFSDQSLSTSLCTAEEFSTSLPGEGVAEGSSVEAEPISVSQYFLSDIFTEVEEA